MTAAARSVKTSLPLSTLVITLPLSTLVITLLPLYNPPPSLYSCHHPPPSPQSPSLYHRPYTSYTHPIDQIESELFIGT